MVIAHHPSWVVQRFSDIHAEPLYPTVTVLRSTLDRYILPTTLLHLLPKLQIHPQLQSVNGNSTLPTNWRLQLLLQDEQIDQSYATLPTPATIRRDATTFTQGPENYFNYRAYALKRNYNLTLNATESMRLIDDDLMQLNPPMKLRFPRGTPRFFCFVA